MTLLRNLLQGVRSGLAILESATHSYLREYQLAEQEIDSTETPDKPPALFPDTLADFDLARPSLGSHLSHAQMLTEQAAALGALRLGLRQVGFDEDESWHLVRLYARLWWGSIHDQEIFDEDDD